MKLFFTLVSFFVSLTVSLWGSPSFAKLKVVTTLPSYADIATNVGGEEVEALSLTKGTQDPHFVDAKPDLILRLNKADFLIRAGLGLEDGWLPPLLTGSRNGKIQSGSEGYLDASSVMTLKEVPKGTVDRSQGDVHPGGNPHFMIDPRNGAILAHAIASKLSIILPSKAEYFQKRADTYVKDLTAKTENWKKLLAPFKGRQVITYHRSWVYFSDWVGLNEVGYVEPKPGIPPSPDHIAKLVNLMKEKHVKLIIMEPYYPKSSAEQLAKLTGATLLVLPTEVQGDDEAKTYFGLFDSITSKLTRGNAQ